MSKKRKTIVIICAVIVVMAGLFYGGYVLSRSRTVQLAGDIVSRVDTDEKVVALSFDDGPTAYTPEILTMLDECDVPATFFLTGREIEENMALAQDIARAGHQIGNHSYSHTRMVMKSRAFIDDEIDRTNTLIRDAGYAGDICFRAPYCKKLLQLPLALSERDMVSVTWDIDPDSYEDVASDPQRITDYVADKAEPGSIILLHIMYEGGANARAAVPLIVKRLRADGYTFVTVNDLFALE